MMLTWSYTGIVALTLRAEDIITLPVFSTCCIEKSLTSACCGIVCPLRSDYFTGSIETRRVNRLVADTWMKTSSANLHVLCLKAELIGVISCKQAL